MPFNFQIPAKIIVFSARLTAIDVARMLQKVDFDSCARAESHLFAISNVLVTLYSVAADTSTKKNRHPTSACDTCRYATAFSSLLELWSALMQSCMTLGSPANIYPFCFTFCVRLRADRTEIGRNRNEYGASTCKKTLKLLYEHHFPLTFHIVLYTLYGRMGYIHLEPSRGCFVALTEHCSNLSR